MEEISQNTVRMNRENVIQSLDHEFNQLLSNVIYSSGSVDEYFGFSTKFENEQVKQTKYCTFYVNGLYTVEKGCDIFDATKIGMFYRDDESVWILYIETQDKSDLESCYLRIDNMYSEDEDMYLSLYSEDDAISLKVLIARYVFGKLGEITADLDESSKVLASLR